MQFILGLQKKYMKKILTLALVVLCGFAATAQTDLKKKIVDSTCACLSELPDIEKKSQNELQMAIGQCMMKKSMEDFMALAQERNLEMTDTEAMQKLGMEIGMDLAKSDCKVMSAILLKIAQENMGAANDKTDAVKEDRAIKGTVQNVELKEFAYITVVSGSKSTQLVWSDFVNNGDSYTKNLLALKSKALEFSYTEKEVYSVKAKAYITVKMITGVK
jgi:hypothetical protein